MLTNERNRADILLTNREVLAIDQTTTMEGDEPVVASTVTLAVTAAETKKLAGAIDDASLFLALRNPNEPTPKPQPVRAAQGVILQKGMIGRWNRVY